MADRFRDLGDTHFYYVVPRDGEFSDVIKQLYADPAQAVYDQTLYLNPQVRDRKVEAGQILLLPSRISQSCTADESMLIDMIGQLDKARRHRREKHGHSQRAADELYARLYNLLITSDVVGKAEQQGSAGLGMWSAYYGFRVKRAASILKSIQDEYIATLKRTGGRLNTKALTRFRRARFMELKQALGSLLRPVVLDSHAVTREGQLGISRNVLIQSFKAVPNATPASFIISQDRLARLARGVRTLGYLGIALDGAYSIHEVEKACQGDLSGSKSCISSTYHQSGRFVGGVGGGALAGESVYLGCNALFGIETLGASMLVCAIPSLAASYYGGKGGSIVGAAGGDFLFRETIAVPN